MRWIGWVSSSSFRASSPSLAAWEIGQLQGSDVSDRPAAIASVELSCRSERSGPEAETETKSLDQLPEKNPGALHPALLAQQLPFL